jgi:glycerophosphoryl diester phosphodiesterase
VSVDTRPLVIGHRGASAARPENTVEAFRHARHLGADWVELDVRRTADDALVVRHDAVFPDGRVLVELDAEDVPDSVPTLAEALAACEGMGVNVEIKNDRRDPDYDREERVAEAVAAWLWAEADGGRLDLTRILVTSFNPRTIGVVHERRPDIPTGLLAFDVADPESVVAQAAAGGHVAVNPWDPFVDEQLMALAADAGLAVFPWTVDDPDRMRRLLALGVAGIITNVPDVARALVDAR